MISMKSILCPTDFSPESHAAAEAALELARRFNSKLMLLHVIEDPVVYLPMLESFPLPTRDQLETYAEERLENWISAPERELTDRELTERESAEREGAQVQHFWTHGHPAEEIVKFAAKSKADLIVISTHGRSGLSRLLLGSIAENISRHAPCPVLVHRASDAHD